MWYLAIPAVIVGYAFLYFYGVYRLSASLKREGYAESDWLPEMKQRVWTLKWLFLVPGVLVLQIIHAVRPR